MSNFALVRQDSANRYEETCANASRKSGCDSLTSIRRNIGAGVDAKQSVSGKFSFQGQLEFAVPYAPNCSATVFFIFAQFHLKTNSIYPTNVLAHWRGEP
jgi:hypothetical protein